MRRVRLATLVLALVTALSGCELEHQGPAPVPTNQAGVLAPLPTSAAPSGGDCGRVGPKIAGVLPALGRDFTTAKANPCVPFAGLAEEVLRFVPQSQRQALAAFQDRVDRLAGAASTVDTVMGCAYQLDRLGVVFYQEKSQALSLGLVVAVRGGFDAAAEVAACYLKVTLTGVRLETTAPGRGPCFRRASVTRAGEGYELFWVGSTTAMCTALDVLRK